MTSSCQSYPVGRGLTPLPPNIRRGEQESVRYESSSRVGCRDEGVMHSVYSSIEGLDIRLGGKSCWGNTRMGQRQLPVSDLSISQG